MPACTGRDVEALTPFDGAVAPGRALTLGGLLLVLILGGAPARAAAQGAAPPPAQSAAPVGAVQHIHIAFVEIKNDPRYTPISTYGNILLKRREHPLPGAQVGIEEAAALVPILHSDFILDRIVADSPADVPAAVTRANDSGTHFFLLDVPAAAYRPLAAAVHGRNLLLFNVSEPDDALRRKLCLPELVHVYPSRAQLMDGLVQYIVSRKWRDLLVLEGPLPADAAMTEAFDHSAKKFGAKIVAQKTFEPGTDPRQREHNDPLLLSAGEDFDVAFVADSAFDFARTVPYHLNQPRPVIGSIGLRPVAWHWTWERYGAPQLDSRFGKIANGRHMGGRDWAAWLAVTMIVKSALQTQSADFAKQRAVILGSGTFDGDKGLAVSVRPWDHQVRQAVLLAAPYMVVAAAPIEGFLHQTNVLDTLGDDRPESPCQLGR